MPVRIQRSRKKGSQWPAGTVYVGRPTKWGNPFKVEAQNGGFVVTHPGLSSSDVYASKDEARKEAVDRFAEFQCIITQPKSAESKDKSMPVHTSRLTPHRLSLPTPQGGGISAGIR